jgi:hypothetical protein
VKENIYILHHYLKEPGMMFVCYMNMRKLIMEQYSMTHEHYWNDSISLLQLTVPVDR